MRASRPAAGFDRLSLALVALCAAGYVLTPHLILGAPIEPKQGLVQKIFFYHVPVAWCMFLSAFVCAGGSIAYLFKGSRRGDAVGVAAAEMVVLFGLGVMVTGPIWARKAWGVWWQWDVRLTTSLLLWMIFVAYLLVRRYGGPGSRKLAAGLALFGAADVPLVYVSVQVWRTIHPKTSVVTSLDPAMRLPFFASLALFTLLWAALLRLRLQAERDAARLDDLHLAAADAGIEEGA